MEDAPLTFEALYTKHGAYLRSILRAARIPKADVEDLVQEIVASLHRSGATHEAERSSVETWLFSVARNHAGKYFRQARRCAEAKLAAASISAAADGAESSVPETETPEEAYFREERRKVLDAALGRMISERREVLKARLFDELPWDTIAALLGVSRITAIRYYDEACRELDGCSTRYSDGRGFALPLPLALDAFGRGREDRAGMLFTGSAAEEKAEVPSDRADGPCERERQACGTSAMSAPPGRALQGERSRARIAASALLEKLWRSRRTHFLLGGIAGVIGTLLLPRIVALRPPPPLPPGDIPPPITDTVPSPDRDRGGNLDRVPAEPQEAASVRPAERGPAPKPSATSTTRMDAKDPDVLDRYLLGAARHAAAEGNRDLALARLQEHAKRCPNSPRASQREALRAQLSKEGWRVPQVVHEGD